MMGDGGENGFRNGSKVIRRIKRRNHGIGEG